MEQSSRDKKGKNPRCSTATTAVFALLISRTLLKFPPKLTQLIFETSSNMLDVCSVSSQLRRMLLLGISFSVLVVLVGIELLARIGSVKFGVTGYIFWYLSHAIVLAVSILSFAELVWGALSRKNVVTFLLVILHLSIALWFIADPRSLHYDSIHETVCVLRLLQHDPSNGYFELCYWGYPSRQYAVSALPSLLLGRTLASLNLGGTLYFICGMPIFAVALLRLAAESRHADLLAAGALTLLWNWSYFNVHLLGYEQSFFPLSLGLTLIGLLVRYWCTRSTILVPVIGLSLLHNLFAYPPALATFGLAMGAIGYLAVVSVRRREPAFALIVAFICCVAAGLTLVGVREDIHKPTPMSESTELLSQLLLVSRHILTQDSGRPFCTPLFHSLLVATLVFSLTGRLGGLSAMVSVWIVGVLYASMFLVGVKAFLFLPWRNLEGLHRALVIAPVFSVLTTYLLSRHYRLTTKRPILVISILLLLSSGMYDLGKTVSQRSPNAILLMIQELQPHLSPDVHRVELDPDLFNAGIVIDDYWPYFQPRIALSQRGATCVATPLRTSTHGLLIKDSHCYKLVQSQYEVIPLAFTSVYGRPLDFVRISPKQPYSPYQKAHDFS